MEVEVTYVVVIWRFNFEKGMTRGHQSMQDKVGAVETELAKLQADCKASSKVLRPWELRLCKVFGFFWHMQAGGICRPKCTSHNKYAVQHMQKEMSGVIKYITPSVRNESDRKLLFYVTNCQVLSPQNHTKIIPKSPPKSS